MSRYIRTLIILLAAVQTVGTMKAQDETSGTGGTASTGPTVRGNVFGGGNLAKVEGSVTVNVSAGTVDQDVYGGGAKAETNTANTGNPVTAVNLSGGIVTGSVYGGGLGQQAVAAQDAVGDPGDADYQPAVDAQAPIPANVNGTVTVTVSGGTAYNVYGCNNLQGAPQKDVTVNIQGGTINNNVFGGGNQADAPGSIVVNVTGGTVKKDVYGGGALANTNTSNWNANGYDIVSGLTVGASSVTGFYTKSGDTYTLITDTDAKAAEGTTYYQAGGTWADGKTSAIVTTKVSLMGGTVTGDAYGGGLGEAGRPAYVYGDVLVELNGVTTVTTTDGKKAYSGSDVAGESSGCVVHRIFGCNNVAGTPKGEVAVYVHATQSSGKKSFGDKTRTTKSADNLEGYDVEAVYGGGNQAEYWPAAARANGAGETETNHVHTNVIIDGCALSCIKTVYGGGNAASSPATSVTVKGAYEINEVFGGGNGLDALDDGSDNPGAHVGFHDYTNSDKNDEKYGFGKAQVNIIGGTIHGVYGGSNSKGNVREVAVAMLNNTNSCTFLVDEAYGGGKNADMDGEARLDIQCVPGIGRVYGGARNADVNNNVTLNITNGTYNKVFGGNNLGGRILGSITVNVEEIATACHPIIIGELYGGGNVAGYSVYGYEQDAEGKWQPKQSGDTELYADPQVNLRSFTSIGNVYGGGYQALMVGSPSLNINVIKGQFARNEYASGTLEEVPYPKHEAGKIGAIGNVYGGGYGADVIGNTTINIATEGTIAYVAGSDNENKNVEGANITGNIYGGGYGASTNVTGDVVVNVGHTGASEDLKANITIGGNVYGGSALGKVNKPSTGDTTDKTTKVNLYAGRITQNVYGGGMGEAPTAAVGETPASPGTKAEVWGDTEVTVYGDMITGAVYGGCNLHGEMKKNATVTVLGGKIGVVFDGTTEHPVPATIPNVLFGGGKGANTSVVGITTVNIGTKTTTTSGDPSVPTTTYAGTANIYGNVYGGSENGSVGVVNVNLYANTIWGDVFGGGYSTAASATAATDVNVTLEGTAFGILTVKDDTNKDVPVTGRVFGCNNLVGSPTGDVVVNVNKTARRDGGAHAKTTENAYNYEVQAVYGGGNQAAYAPTASGAKSQVNISGCYETSIEYVYGGGNAAPMNTATNVKVEGAFEIGYTFGGGNGSDKIKSGTGWTENPGANVNGNANSVLVGGYIHNVFGGSNTKGTIKGATSIDISETGNSCDLITENVYGAGKSADVNGDIDIRIGCPAANVKNVYGGAMAAKISGNVTLTVTSGILENVYGGNNESGGIGGKITVNIEEVDECKPIVIGNLYGGGNLAPYPGDLQGTNTNPNIEVNVKSFTSIGNIFGGGRGDKAVVTGNTVVNINEVLGRHAATAWGAQTLPINGKQVTIPAHAANEIGAIGNVYGGGDEASVHGNTTINIANSEKVEMKFVDDNAATTDIDEKQPAVLGAKITGNVYGGGNEADVTGNTYVNVCAVKASDLYTAVAEGTEKVTIAGNVFGGGKGKADNYYCEKAMVGVDGAGLDANYTDGNTHVIIGNGTIGGTVYGGGQIGRVERNTTVTIGLGDGVSTGTPVSAPVIAGNVFGAGAGEEEHGYAALVRGNPTVTIRGNAKIGKSVYGGGEIASVARYKVAKDPTEAAEHGVEVDMPYVLENSAYGHCVVTIGGYAEIGPDNMRMYHEGVSKETDKPDDYGHVFGAGKGVLPKVYTAYGEANSGPRRRILNSDKTASIWDYFADEKKYFEFIQTLALATETQVTIGDHAFVKGSVYGGSENGLVQFNTNVNIQDHCQIGQGKEITTRYEDYTGGNLFDLTAPPIKSGSGSEAVYYDLECASWDYGQDTDNDGKKDLFAPYDPKANATGDLDKYPEIGGEAKSTAGGRRFATDGHTFYGNVFGGGSGSVPYFDTNTGVSRYIMSAGWVKGNTNVNITGGHILTNVYGGNEATNVDGTATVTMSGGTLGVPRTLKQIDAHPVTCYLFGAGKGDQRVFFNKSTNVKEVEVSITGGRIYGSVFGGGEDGHVLRNVTMTIGNDGGTGPTIGTWGTSYVDGNVFGGGRGFGGDAYTAGNVAGSVKMEIKGGTMLGSIYGGGRLGSVGYGLFDAETNGQPTQGYGEMRADTDTEEGFSTTGYFTKGRGHIDITISGGTIGNDHEYIVPKDFSSWSAAEWTTWKTDHHIPKTEFDTVTGRLSHTKGGNVFAGGMGRFYQLDGSTYISAVDWWKLGCVKSTKLTITGGTIKSNVYGGGELGQVVGYHTTGDKNLGTEISISGNAVIGTEVKDGSETAYTFGSVFGGGYGSTIEEIKVGSVTSKPKFIAGLVKEDTKIDMQGGAVKASIYGGGEMASVGESTTSGGSGSTYVTVSDGTVGIAPITVGGGTRYFGGAKMGNVYGGGSGHPNVVRAGRIFKNANVTISGGTIYHNVYGGGAYGTVGDFKYTEANDPVTNTQKVFGVESLNTGGTGTATVTISGGTIGYDGKENGMVFGSSRGDIAAPGERDDHTAWTYDTHVVIGTSGSGPVIKGSVYGSGENGHTFNDAVVTVNGGTIGVSGDASYAYRGNVYGGGCGTDKYYSGTVPTGHVDNDGGGDKYNPLAGIVYGNTTVNINGGQVVRNVYGAGAMGSVGKATTTGAVTTISGGTTTINVNGGTIGVNGTDGDGNVFGAARGDASATINEFALVRKNTNVSVTGGTIIGNVYGGGELGSVGTFNFSANMRTFTWQDTDGTANTENNDKNTGVCHVTVNGGSAVINGKVFGAGKGLDDTFWCEKGIAYSTNVNVLQGTVNGNVYGGGEVGRVETDSHVKIGNGDGTAEGTSAPTILGSVFGGGAGVETHGYSALVRGNTTVTVEGNASVAHSVYGGGEIASVGKYGLDAQEMPSILQGGGYCYVTVQGRANIAGDVFGAGKGVTPHFDKDNSDPSKLSRRMKLKAGWESQQGDARFEWDYFSTEADYSTYLETLALVTHPEVAIDGNATVNHSVFGGGELGLTKGSVIVTIKGGTIVEDVYGGGSLANTNTTSAVDLDGDGVTETIHPTTTVNLTGGSFRDAYGGGLGQLASGTQKAIPAEVGGDVTVTLDGSKVNGSIFGANNINGTPLGHVLVHVKRTIPRDGHTFDVDAVFGGGNNADYVPTDTKQYSEVIIEGCDLTSINQVYGGGNAAATPGTSILVKGTKIIHELFGGGNGERGAAYAANVGYHFDGTNRTDYARGDGKALVQLMAGKIDFVYGGSNSNGDIRGGSTTSNIPITGTSPECCSDLQVGRIFGGGKNADMASGSDIVIECQTSSSWIEEIYAGAENANVGGNVRLTITSGKFGRVFGGNKSGGRLNGSITVNIEESPSCGIPVIIGELYAGGNKAPYSIYGYDDGGTMLTSGVAKHASPVVNVRAFTSIGNIFGGGYGEDAVMYGSPTININEVEVDHTDKSNAEFQGNLYRGETKTIVVDPGETPYDVVLYPHEDGKMGVIGNVYGGGNAAKVYGDTNVNIGTKTTDVFHTPLKKTVHNSQTGVDEEVATDEADRTHTVKGADIRGNVYGGGNEAEVTGDTNVKIGITATP